MAIIRSYTVSGNQCVTAHVACSWANRREGREEKEMKMEGKTTWQPRDTGICLLSDLRTPALPLLNTGFFEHVMRAQVFSFPAKFSPKVKRPPAASVARHSACGCRVRLGRKVSRAGWPVGTWPSYHTERRDPSRPGHVYAYHISLSRSRSASAVLFLYGVSKDLPGCLCDES